MAASTEEKKLHPAEIAKLEAEAELVKMQARKERAEARKAKNEADDAKYVAALRRLKLEEAQDDADRDAVSDDRLRVYRFNGAVESSSTRICIATLASWDRLDPECDMEIIFNSPGGGVIDGMALFDQISALSLRGGGKHKITLGCRGYAASMAGILLQAGDHRWIGKQSYFMIHEVSAGTGGKIGEIKDDVKFYDAMCAQVVDLFVERSGGKIKKADFVRRWERQDWWMLSTEALEHGFVDEVR